MNKRVLIIGYLHPHTRAGGSFRLLPLAKNLPDFGWEPVLLTPRLLSPAATATRIEETDYGDSLGVWGRLFGIKPEKDPRQQAAERLTASGLGRFTCFLLSQAGALVNYPDAHKGWREPALAAGRSFLNDESFDAILSCHPVASHLVAAALSREFSLPWVADFPDLWSGNHNYGYGPCRRWLDTRLEKKTLAGAKALTTVSAPWADKLKRLHGERPVYAITNGFNPAEMNEPPTELSDNFSISYTGLIYPGRQDIQPLLGAIRELITEGKMDAAHVALNVYGREQPWLTRLAAGMGLESVVRQHGAVSREAAVNAQRQSQLLLLLDWDLPGELGVYPGKIFEYLAARRPVLATGGNRGSVVGNLLAYTRAGVHAVTAAEIKLALTSFYSEFRATGKVEYNGLNTEIDKYSHRQMTAQFAKILDGLAGD
ncbi:glycosyltransferase [Chloroflexota bacterium]